MFNKRISRNASAVVTGAGSGIGRAFAVALAEQGSEIVCADINKEGVADTVRRVEQAGGRGLAVECDVSDLAAMEGLADQAESWLYDPISLVVNNAGVGAGGQVIGDIPIEDWRWTVNVNLWGVVHGCHVFAPRLRLQGKGGIINVCSAASFGSAPLMGPYNLTKAGVLGLTETLHAEMAGTGVHVTALCPTFVKTNIAHSGPVSEASSRAAQKLMDWTGVSADKVARKTLGALDRNRLYVLPQLDARVTWRMKRLAPGMFTAGAGRLGQLGQRFAGSESGR